MKNLLWFLAAFCSIGLLEVGCSEIPAHHQSAMPKLKAADIDSDWKKHHQEFAQWYGEPF